MSFSSSNDSCHSTGGASNQEKADSNFIKCPQLLVFANIISKQECLGTLLNFTFACGSTVPNTLHTYSPCPSSTAVLTSSPQLVNCGCILLLPVDTNVRLSAIIRYFSRLTLSQKEKDFLVVKAVVSSKSQFERQGLVPALQLCV